MDTDSLVSARRRRVIIALAFACVVGTAAPSAGQQERIYFPAVDNVTNVLVEKLNAENTRIDISAWYLSDGLVINTLIKKHQQGVPIRLIGDRGSIFEIDPNTKTGFYRLANAGIPIRLRYNPTWFPEIVHWKATIFVGQNLVSFGSANYTPFELAPASSTNYKDETVLFTNDPVIVNAFKTQFDRMWNDTLAEPRSRVSPPYFRDWNAACQSEPACADYKTRYPTPAPMHINRARLEADHPMPPDMVWGQGPLFNNRIIQEINNEVGFVDFALYRLTVSNITDALLAKHTSGIPVRIIMEPQEYRNKKWPEFWLTHAYMDKLWAAGVPIKKRIHTGLTHMKMLVTSRYATNASSNFASEWQRDHNFFVSAALKPAIYGPMRNRFTTMWNDSSGFASFTPEPPDAPSLNGPASGATGESTTPTLTWQRAAFATSFDVYLGTSSGMTKVANVPAQLVNNPPLTYSWRPSTALQGGTTYYWRVVSRTFANITASSGTRSFTTAGSAPAPSPTPTPPPPPPPPPPSDPPGEIVLYASDVSRLAGNWIKAPDASAAGGLTLRNPDRAAGTMSAPLANPPDYVEATFNAVAGVRYRVWLRIRAAGNSKWNDSVFVQYSGAVNGSGSPIYRIGTTAGILVNLWTCADCQSFGWGWQRKAYWLNDTGDVWFTTTGPQTIRIQVREDGLDIDQIVISPSKYATDPPGPVSNDSTIVPKP